MALSLSQPAPFLQTPGEPPIPFTAWIKTFDNFLLAVGEELPNARKRALLIHCLGTEGQRLFYTLNVSDQGDDTYTSALSAIRDFFVPKVNVVAERYRFRQRVGETTDQYVAALRELAATCEFGAMEDEMIRDQLVEKTNSARIRERLLLEVPLDIKKAVTVARQIETATAEAKAMIASSDNSVRQFNNITGSDGAKVKSTLRVDLQNLPVHVLVTAADLSSTQLIFLDALLRMQCAGTVTKQDILQRYVVETNG